MSQQAESPILLRYVCPKCSYSFETSDFTNEYPARWFWRGPGARFMCPGCKTQLKIRERFYLYFHLFAAYFCLVVAAGFSASLLVEEKMHVTFFMLGAMLLFVPLILLAAANNKAECASDGTHN